MRFYATINRSINGQGTKVRLKEGKHKVLLAIANDPKFMVPPEIKLKPVHVMSHKDWGVISGELKVGARVGFTKVFRDNIEIFTLCNKSMAKQVEQAIKNSNQNG